MYLNAGKHTIKDIGKDGESITLDDDSNWKIFPFDKAKVAKWRSGDEVNVAANVGSKSKISHAETNETVEATYLG
jgi:hypothetical protein